MVYLISTWMGTLQGRHDECVAGGHMMEQPGCKYNIFKCCIMR